MKDTFDVLDDIFSNFVNDLVLPGLMGIVDVSDMEVCDSKFRRNFADSTLVTPEELNFIDFSYIPSHSETSNFLVNRETLELNIYSGNIYQANMIYKEIHRIFKDKYSNELQCTTPCQAGCPIQGIVRYSFRAKGLVGS
jgi:hypothetical protein